jgi:PadR family transcriptional regulator, regulatory protein AphA
MTSQGRCVVKRPFRTLLLEHSRVRNGPLSSPRLTPFSFVVLTLVGEGGATAPELAAMRERGRLFWSAPRSQWFAEPKRLAEAGLLRTEQEQGVTGPRTRYRLTDAGRAAVADWLRTPMSLPKVQNEALVRHLALDLAEDPEDLRAGLDGLRAELEDVRGHFGEAQEAARELPARERRLEANHRLAAAWVDALEAWADEVEALLDER